MTFGAPEKERRKRDGCTVVAKKSTDGWHPTRTKLDYLISVREHISERLLR